MARQTTKAKAGGKTTAPKRKSNGGQAASAPQQATGMPIFYNQPEVLDSKRHEGLELKPVTTYEFSSGVNAIPITAAEFSAASRDYPIVFTAGGNPGAVAIVGLRKDENLMLEARGKWRSGTYIPAYVRRYPFIFLRSDDGDQYALCIDRACKQLGKGKKNLLFDGPEMGDLTKNALEFCKAFQQQHMATEQVIEVLKQHDLLMPNQGRFNLPDGRSLAITDFMTVDEKKFNELPDKAFLQIRKSGALPAIYCHLVSMGAWQRLVERFASVKPAAKK